MRADASRRTGGHHSPVPRGSTLPGPAARPPRRALAGVLLMALLATGAAPVLSNDPLPAPGFEPERWLQGAEGLFGAIESLKGDQPSSPMVVYFYTDWCGYCRQFERELLGTPEVKRYFEGVLAVRINPEAGAREREIAEYYRVAGYPTFFVHSGSSKTLSRVERMRVEGGQPRLMTPDEFIAAVRAAGER